MGITPAELATQISNAERSPIHPRGSRYLALLLKKSVAVKTELEEGSYEPTVEGRVRVTTQDKTTHRGEYPAVDILEVVFVDKDEVETPLGGIMRSSTYIPTAPQDTAHAYAYPNLEVKSPYNAEAIQQDDPRWSAIVDVAANAIASAIEASQTAGTISN